MSLTALVTGVGGPAGRACATYLAERGYRVVGTDVREVASPATVLHLVPPARDPAFPAALLRLAERTEAQLLVPTVTEELPIVARMRPELRARRIALTVSDAPGIDVAGDKLATAVHLRSSGVSAPATFPGTAPRAEVVRTLGLPLLSKPRFGRGGRGVQVHHAAESLPAPGPEERVFQEFLAGEEFDLNLFVERGGAVAAAVALRKTALKDGLVGNALSVERADRPDVVALGTAAARALGLEGPLDMDIRLGADGKPGVLEVNARLGANVLSAREVLDALDDAWRNGRCD